MPGLNIINRCGATHNARVPIGSIVVSVEAVGHSEVTITFPPNPALTPPFAGEIQTYITDVSGSAEKEFYRVNYVRGVEEGLGVAEDQFMITTGCCCPCRWDLSSDGTIGPGPRDDASLLITYNQTRDIDGVVDEFESNLHVDPYLRGFSGGRCKIQYEETTPPQFNLSACSMDSYGESFSQSNFAEPGDSYDSTVTLTGATRLYEEDPSSFPIELLVEHDKCSGGEYVVIIEQTGSASKVRYNEDLEIDIETTISYDYTITYTIIIGGAGSEEGAKGSGLQGGDLQTGGLTVGSLQTGKLTSGYLQTGTLRSGGLRTERLSTGVLDTGRLSSGSVHTSTLGNTGGLSSGGLQSSSL